MQKSVTYFEKMGKEFTEQTLSLARQRAEELGLKCVVLASYTGFTAEKALEIFAGERFHLIVVGGARKDFPEALREHLESKGHHVIFSAEVRHDFSELVARAYQGFSEGTKVAVEIVAMAVDAGLLRAGTEVVSVAGTGTIGFPPGGGADTALVVTASRSKEFNPDYSLLPKPARRKVRELICKPR